ncbi:MAG: 7-cyano-7-deazaguanine synthase QueC [Desulfobacteraceae bacterium]
MTEKAVVLLSGGIDSSTAAAIAVSSGYRIYCMSFSYGQRHVSELEAAGKVAEALRADDHRIVRVDLADIGGSALTDDIEIPKNNSVEDIANIDEIPVTYVPARNTIFLSYALAWAEVLKSDSIFIGVTAIDYSGYPDCRPEYIQAFEKMANLATKAGVTGDTVLKIQTPLIDLSKAGIIKTGHTLGLDYGLTVSCYDADESGAACGQCDSCLHRKKGFHEAGIKDPTRYRK